MFQDGGSLPGFAAATGYFQLRQIDAEAQANQQVFDFLLDAGRRGLNYLSDTLYPATSTTTPGQHSLDLSTIRAFAGTSVEGNQLVLNLHGGDGGTGTLALDMASGTSSLNYGGDRFTFVNGVTGIKQDQNGLVFELEASQSGVARAIDFNSLGGQAAIQLGNGSAVTVAAGSQISIGSDNVRASTFDDNGALEKQQDVFTTGTTAIKYLDPRNTHPYNELNVTKGADGQITAAQLQLEQNVIAAGGSIGQLFGSAIGNALAPNDPFQRILTTTVAGLIGQKLLQTFTASLTLDASRFVLSDFASVSGLDVAHAGIGAISSFLTAELGHEMGLTGLSGQLFNGIAGGVTGSVLNQVVDKIGTGVSFDAAIGAIQWGTAVTQAGYNVASIVGSYLGQELVPAQTHEGAVGGQLLGAVGSAIGISIVLANALGTVLNFIIPNSAFTAGWAATFARVKELGLGQLHGSDFIGGVVGWLNSVNKAGLGAEAVLDEFKVTTDTSHWLVEWRDDGDGINEFHHDWILEATSDHPNAGMDSLLFGSGIAHSDRNRRAKARGVLRLGGWRRAQRVRTQYDLFSKKFA